MTAYYNEFDHYAAQWLRNLISNNLIPHGEVDERSIVDVQPGDLAGFTQCHFFAGIGGWALAARLAGWPDDRPVWTGSCPCQPFSSAGKRAGFADERHLWPAWFRLIEECRPPVVFGEQVASKDGYAWLDVVQTDMENAGYAVGAVVLPAAGFGAPHGRHRIFFVADADGRQLEWQPVLQGAERDGKDAGRPEGRGGAAACGDNGRLAHDNSDRCELRREGSGAMGHGQATGADRGPDGLADAESERRDGRESSSWAARRNCFENSGDTGRTRPTNGFWRDADWLFCRDGRWRPVEPGTFPLAHGVPARVGRLRAYGNAIVPQVAAEIIRAYLDCMPAPPTAAPLKQRGERK